MLNFSRFPWFVHLLGPERWKNATKMVIKPGNAQVAFKDVFNVLIGHMTSSVASDDDKNLATALKTHMNTASMIDHHIGEG